MPRQLPLHQKHVDRSAKMGQFGDWEVPLYYTSILQEHEAVRTKAGLFDISHMGEFFFSGAHAASFLDSLLSRDIAGLEVGQASYMALLNDDGCVIDDIIVYRFADERFLMIVNAGNVEKDEAWIRSKIPSNVLFENKTNELGLLALQGPLSEPLIRKAFGDDAVEGLGYYKFRSCDGSGMIARTGYTGEDGFELMVPLNELEKVWDDLFEAGGEDLVPVGFGCRDTLRLEAGMPLCGHDMSEETNALEARLGWTLDFSKENFIGKKALEEIKSNGVNQKLVGFEMLDRGIPREHYKVQVGGDVVGEVTSGSFAPTLKKNIGLAYVKSDFSKQGTEIEIMIRDKPAKAKITKLPFYKRIN